MDNRCTVRVGWVLRRKLAVSERRFAKHTGYMKLDLCGLPEATIFDTYELAKLASEWGLNASISNRWIPVKVTEERALDGTK